MQFIKRNAPAPSGGRQKNDLILIVEDERDMSELIRYNLRNSRYRTIAACNGAQALRIIQYEAPALILLDILLPEMNGWEVCRRLRECTNGKDIPVIMLTALSSEEDRVKGLALGASDYLTKPFSVNELVLKVGRVLEKERTIKALAQRAQEQDTSFRFLVHELQNAVSCIGGFTTLAAEKGTADHYLPKISSTALHMERVLGNAALLARLERDEDRIMTTPVAIDEVVADVADSAREEAGKRGISIVRTNATAARIWGSVTALRQVLMNLLSNAVKFNRAGGTVLICYLEGDDWLSISVRDEGCGIPSPEVHRVFEKFYRCAGSAGIKGSGIGLYVVKLLVRAMDGSIRASSIPGKGSVFTATFRKVTTSPSLRHEGAGSLPDAGHSKAPERGKE